MSDLAALRTIERRAPLAHPRIAVVLGSGWGDLADHVQGAVCISYSELEGFPKATVAGHNGMLWLGHIGEQPVAVMSGRQHGYETGAVDGMKTPLRLLKRLGCTVLVQTNAAGSLRPDMPPLSLMVLTDHINLAQHSPLVWEGGSERFVNLVDAYDPALRAQASHIALQRGVNLHQGVYAWAFGPQFETPAEIRMFRLMGADAVGMSTVLETIAARHMGARVLGISCITNLAAGMTDAPLNHEEVQQTAHRVKGQFSALLRKILEGIGTEPTA